MRRDMLLILSCPKCLGDLDLISKKEKDGDVEDGILKCKKCSREYQISKGIINFIPEHSIKFKN